MPTLNAGEKRVLKASGGVRPLLNIGAYGGVEV